MSNDNILFAVIASFVFIGTNGYRERTVDGTATILAADGETFSLHCQIDSAVQYCTFHGPRHFQTFSITDGDVINGKCVLQRTMSPQEVGKWYCYVGGRYSMIEETFELNVRMVDKLAAVVSNMSVTHGDDVTLECLTTEGLIPLSYCRFEPPNGGRPFRLDASVNKSRPLFNKYYFPEHKSLDRGDCAVTIHKVRYEDVGEWKCGAGLNDKIDGNKEYMDSITLMVEGSKWGIVLGSVLGGVAIIGIAFIAWKKRMLLGSSNPIGRTDADAAAPQELIPMTQSIRHSYEAPEITIEPASPSLSGSGSPPEVQPGPKPLEGLGQPRFRVTSSPKQKPSQVQRQASVSSSREQTPAEPSSSSDQGQSEQGPSQLHTETGSS